MNLKKIFYTGLKKEVDTRIKHEVESHNINHGNKFIVKIENIYFYFLGKKCWKYKVKVKDICMVKEDNDNEHKIQEGVRFLWEGKDVHLYGENNKDLALKIKNRFLSNYIRNIGSKIKIEEGDIVKLKIKR